MGREVISLIIFIASTNLLGLLPYSFTPTTQLPTNISMACGKDFRLMKSPSFQVPHYDQNLRFCLRIFKCPNGFF